MIFLEMPQVFGVLMFFLCFFLLYLGFPRCNLAEIHMEPNNSATAYPVSSGNIILGTPFFRFDLGMGQN